MTSASKGWLSAIFRSSNTDRTCRKARRVGLETVVAVAVAVAVALLLPLPLLKLLDDDEEEEEEVAVVNSSTVKMKESWGVGRMSIL